MAVLWLYVFNMYETWSTTTIKSVQHTHWVIIAMHLIQSLSHWYVYISTMNHSTASCAMRCISDVHLTYWFGEANYLLNIFLLPMLVFYCFLTLGVQIQLCYFSCFVCPSPNFLYNLIVFQLLISTIIFLESSLYHPMTFLLPCLFQCFWFYSLYPLSFL